MKRLLAGAVSAALALVGLGVATAAPATAIEPSIGASCSSLDAYIWDVPSGTEVTVTVDGETIATDPVTDSYYSRSFPLDWSQPHDWTVLADVPEDAGDDISQSGTTEPCASDPNVTADAWTSCQDVTVSVMGYPAETRATIVVDGATLVDEQFDGSYYTTQSFDWTVDHSWSVTVDATDDALDRSWEGSTTACDADPNVVLEVSAWCGSVETWGWGYPAGSQVAITVDGQVLASTTVDEGGYLSLSAQPDPAVDFGWQVTVQDPAGQVLRERSDVVTGCAPSVPSVVSASATCSALSVWVDVAAVEPGSSIEVEVDEQVVGTETLDSYFYRDFDLSWDATHSWTVRVIAPDGSETASESGVSEPCASDPYPPLMVHESCGALWVEAQDAVFAEGSRFELIVDGEVVTDYEFEGYASGSAQFDHLLPHTYTATATAPDGTVFDNTGTTTPCTQSAAVQVYASCAAIDVTISDQWIGEGARVRLDVDGVTMVDEAVPTDTYPFTTTTLVDQTVAHEWTVTLDAADDTRDWTESGTAGDCAGLPTYVAPEPVVQLTTCGATPADIVPPASTDAITYTVTDDGLLATANPGYSFSWQLTELPYFLESDTQATVPMYALLSPYCDLEVTTVQAVCDGGTPYVEYSVTPPPGYDEDDVLYIEWEGPGGAYEVIYGDPGFGHPLEGRIAWPGFITNDDGTISPAYDPSRRLDDVDMGFSLSTDVEDPFVPGSYRIHYLASVEDAPTADPCATTGGDHDQSHGKGHAFGRDHVGHPVMDDHPVFGGLPGRGVVHHHG